MDAVSTVEKTPRQLLNRDDLRRRRQQLMDIGAYKKNAASQDLSDSEVSAAAHIINIYILFCQTKNIL